MSINAARVADVMGGEGTLGRSISSIGELREMVEFGLPVTALDAVVRHVTHDDRGAAELKYRIVPKTTLRRRQRLDPEESQRLERLARMTALAEDVWEDPDLAHEFLTSAQPQLGGERPVDLARSDLGTRQVEMLLMKIEYALPV
ncbi:antitoxin Xre/MbcA/ParS toxin-binding domain-containing protein [Longimicrobium sp.]|uniref:antitoxin Xre/MbcA/ParS toxin-binding domain-containing protein n=1 Tax=Longimicrobium sp. TaxID=2029185 RepID=UPI002E2ECB8F|nr:antitoxin Xre/MbcA/ParS toxin-binding domain-containing protein [Longimicrobium sp.]HEX6038719.1 antitoxin Xre/MbcA/ParS toxin-binding domain-containing protein [Longimicrobium sp.]